MATEGGKNVRYVVFARLSDGLALAHFKKHANAATIETANKVLTSGNLKAKSQLTVTIDHNIGTLHLAAGEDDARRALEYVGEFDGHCEPFHHHGSTRFDAWLASGDAASDGPAKPAPALPKAARDRQNVHFKCLFLEGFPFVVAVATRRVDAGDELLVDYGAEFWRKPDLFDERGVAALRSPELVAVHGKLAAALRRGGDA